jgi:hypothetical protein
LRSTLIFTKLNIRVLKGPSHEKRVLDTVNRGCIKHTFPKFEVQPTLCLAPVENWHAVPEMIKRFSFGLGDHIRLAHNIGEARKCRTDPSGTVQVAICKAKRNSAVL